MKALSSGTAGNFFPATSNAYPLLKERKNKKKKGNDKTHI